MGQVPQTQFLIIGNGRLSRHLSHYMTLLELPFSVWHRRSPQALIQSLADHTHLLFAVSDTALLELTGLVKTHTSAKLVHFSGASSIGGVAGAHPLFSFSDKLSTLETYRAIPFILDGNESLADLLPGLPNPFYRLDPRQKAFYHSMCVMSGNFTTLLWEKFFAEADRLGLPREALIPYLKAVLHNLAEAKGGESVLTGPLARKDYSTLETNLFSLRGDPYQKIYRAFVETRFPERTWL